MYSVRCVFFSRLFVVDILLISTAVEFSLKRAPGISSQRKFLGPELVFVITPFEMNHFEELFSRKSECEQYIVSGSQ